MQPEATPLRFELDRSSPPTFKPVRTADWKLVVFSTAPVSLALLRLAFEKLVLVRFRVGEFGTGQVGTGQIGTGQTPVLTSRGG